MTTLADLERVASDMRKAAKTDFATKSGTTNFLVLWADTIAAYIAAQRERDAKFAASEAEIAELKAELEATKMVMRGHRLRFNASEAACAPFLKDGETPAECITRWRADADGVLELLRQEKIRSERAEAACAQMRNALNAFEEDQVPNDVALELRAAALATDAGKEPKS